MKIKNLLAGLLCLLAFPAHAELEIDVTGAMREAMPIAFPRMINDGNSLGLFGIGMYANRIRNVVTADLDRSGLFRIIDDGSYIEDLTSINQRPNFVDWRAIKAHALVQSAVQETSDGKLKVEFRLWDVMSGEQLQGQSYTTTKDNWRRIAHIISDAIYERLTGEKGYFDTRIVYVSESGPATRRVKRLAIMDQDGENHRFLTSGATMALTLRFSPNMQKVTYLSFSGTAPKVYIMDIESGRQELLGHFPGMTFAPVFSPDSSKVLLSLASNGNTEIYEMDLKRKTSKQLTKHPAIDTSPSYSPDGKQIVFNSDRGGNQQLYIMDADGSNPHRISFGNGRYATPVWSPRGDYIAFTKMAGGQFYIGVMHPDGSGERLLASGYLVEGPTWSPNGRVLMYFRQDRGTSAKNSPVHLYTIDLTGYNERMVVTPADGSDPAWSPLLPEHSAKKQKPLSLNRQRGFFIARCLILTIKAYLIIRRIKMSVFYLILAGIFETMWPFGFKLAHGSAYRDWWIAGSLLAVALSIIFFYLSQKNLPMLVAYPIWTALGAIGTFAVGVMYFHDFATWTSWLGICLLVAGIVLIK